MNYFLIILGSFYMVYYDVEKEFIKCLLYNNFF